jgi:hypothetical protein
LSKCWIIDAIDLGLETVLTRVAHGRFSMTSPTRALRHDARKHATGVRSVLSSLEKVPIDAMVKRQHDDATYLFAVGMRNAPTRGTITVRGLPARAEAEVLGEKRSLSINDGRFEDDFRPNDVHPYKIRPQGGV